MGCWVIVSSTAPASMTATPAANPTAAGATQMSIASGAGNSGGQTISVNNGDYVYVVELDVDITWAGSSNQYLVLETTGGTFMALLSYWASAGAGHIVDTWSSPIFITGGTKYPPAGVGGEGAAATTFWGHYQQFLLPDNFYYYIVAAYFDITWAGASDASILFWDEANAVRGADYAVAWHSPNDSSHHVSEWDSKRFITGGTNARPDTNWANDGDTINGGVRTLQQPTPDPVGSPGHGNGWYQNTSGSDKLVRGHTNFVASGYTTEVWVYVTADDPSTVGGGGGGGGSSGRSASIISMAKKLVIPERRIWLPT